MKTDTEQLADLTAKLRRLTERLPRVHAEARPSFPEVRRESNHVIVKMADGSESPGYYLWRDQHCAAARWFNEPGQIFPLHAHGEHEVLMVSDGCMILELAGETITMTAGIGVYVPPDTPHSATFTLPTWYFAITVPAAEAWPNVPCEEAPDADK